MMEYLFNCIGWASVMFILFFIASCGFDLDAAADLAKFMVSQFNLIING